jgi:hypothetical protein
MTASTYFTILNHKLLAVNRSRHFPDSDTLLVFKHVFTCIYVTLFVPKD